MKILIVNRHFHKCFQCLQRVSCSYIHERNKPDLIGSLCDGCTKHIIKELDELNV